MWILNFLPDWIFYALFFIGIVGLIATFVMKFIPFVYVYRTPIQVVSVILIAIGTYMSGAISNNEKWEAKVKELEIKLAGAEVASAKVNTEIVEKVVVKREYYKERGKDVIQYIDREVVKYDERCVIPKEFVEAHNSAATK
jgi:uncharacterized membrane protein